ncbi:MAG: ABC transporter permease [Chloroflexi bacterium]|nr:ABC transporter permease [Chloroflexota bacterium]
MNRQVELFLRTVRGRAYPRVVGSLRERAGIIWEVTLPLITMTAFVFVYRTLSAPEEYIGFVVMGGAMTAFWLNVLWSMAAQLYWDKDQGNLALYILAPGPMMAILLGMALGGMMWTMSRAVAIVAAGTLLFGVQFSTANLALLALIFFLTMAALYGMGMLFASLFLFFGREAWHITNLFQEPVYLLSGFYFPVKALGPWVAAAASLIPLTLGLDAMRQLLFPQNTLFGFLSVPVEIAILVVLAVVMIGAARFSLQRLETLSRRHGRLTDRRG